MNTPAKVLAAPNHAWKIEESLDLYQVEAWGKGYFSINADGHVVIRPSMDASREIDLYEVVQGLKARDLHTPVVIRFSDILAHRLRHLAEAFGTAISENDYRNRYAAVFPIKVNQQRLVVEEVYRYGKEFGFGLEVGSKPELLAVMSITEDAPGPAWWCATASRTTATSRRSSSPPSSAAPSSPWWRTSKRFM